MTRLTAVAASAVLGATLLQPAAAEPADRPTPTAAELAASISPIELNVSDLELNVRDLETETTDGEETVISLTTDVLFDFGKADLPPNAPAKFKEVLADIPDGTAIKVEGHTDSIGADDFNQQLSEDRADAVAAAIRDVRPDLELQVRGFGESQPVAPNERAGADNPEGRAQNRRVEIRYAD